MKRKFSFNLAPVKVPMKPEPSPKYAPEPSPAHAQSQSHRKHYSKDGIASLSSPYINRRVLDPQTERDLRRACVLILQNFKPSDHDIIDKDPKLDFKGLGRRRDHKLDASEVTVRKPTGAPAELRGPHDARKLGHKSDFATKSYPDLAIRANSARRRGEPADPAEKETGSRRMKSPTSELPRSATARTETDSDGLGTPLTGSTDTHLNNGSTAPTSAAVTSGRSSTRMSRQYESAAAAADAQAAEWMRHEREKRKQQQVFQPQSAPQPVARPPSRARSIRDGLKEYIFPGSTSVNTSQSHESLRAFNNRPSSSQGPRRSGSSSGWRSWGLQRMSSSRSSSRPGTSRARLENQDIDLRHNEVNLNRELPPLPSLDSWKDSERPNNENTKSQPQGAHIASLMRPQEQKRQEYAAGIRQQHRRSGSDTLAVRYTNAYPQASASTAVARSPSHAKLASQSISPRGRSSSRLDTSRDFDDMVSALSSSRNLEEQLKFRVTGHTHQHQPSTSTFDQSPSAKISTDFRSEGPPNFSRKISMDVISPQPDFAYPNIVHVAQQPKDEQKSRLRKVFSGWMLKKEKKDDWMQRIEKEGVREGVMIQDEAALPPVVRY